MKKKEVIFNKEHPKGKVREIDEQEIPHHDTFEEPTVPTDDVILTSPNGTRFKLTVSDAGKLKAEKEHKTE